MENDKIKVPAKVAEEHPQKNLLTGAVGAILRPRSKGFLFF